MPVERVTGKSQAEPVGGFVAVGVLFLAAGILIPIFFNGTGSVLIIGAIISFVRASRAHDRNVQAQR